MDAVELRDGKNCMAYAGNTPWHGKGQKVNPEDVFSISAMMEKSGMNTTVETAPLWTGEYGLNPKTGQPFPNRESDVYQIFRSQDGRKYGECKKDWHPLQNIDAFNFFKPFLDTRECELHTCGSLFDGRRIWVLAKIRSIISNVAGDEIIPFILLSNAHTGKHAVHVGFSPTRVVCWNTLSAAIGSQASKLIRIFHSKAVKTNLEAVRDSMNLAKQAFEATTEQFEFLAKTGVNQNDLQKYVKIVLNVDLDKPNSELPTRTINRVERVVNLANYGRGNERIAGTYWAAYNGLTELLNWEHGRSVDTRLESLWFGQNATLNQKALKTALDMADNKLAV